MDIQKLKKEFENNLPNYEKVIEIITEIIATKIKTPIHSMKFRIKEFESFYNKISRKNYDEPLKQCTDIAGIRVITLFQEDSLKLIRSLKRELKIIEEIKKEKKENEFCYSSTHLIINLKPNLTENENLLKIPCEIQIRTILQEAWAEMEHHLNYKHIGVDKLTLRKINSLSALLEIADDQFQQINDSFNTQLKSPTNMNKITPEALYHYCKKIFPWAWKNIEVIELFEVENILQYNKLLKYCTLKGILTIKQLDNLYLEQKEELEKDDLKHVKDILNNPLQWPKLYKKVKETNHFYSPATLLTIMIQDLYK